MDLETCLPEREVQLVGLRQAVAKRDANLARLEQQVSSVHASASWQLTSPLRRINQLLRRLRTSVALYGTPTAIALRIRAQGTATPSAVALEHVRVHVDQPAAGFSVVGRGFVLSGWAVDLRAGQKASVRVRIGNVTYPCLAQDREDVQREFAALCALPAAVGFRLHPGLALGLRLLRIDAAGPDGSWIPVHRSQLLCLPRSGGAATNVGRRWASLWGYARLWRRKVNAGLTDLRLHLDKPHGIFALAGRATVLFGWGVDLRTASAAAVRVRIGKAIHQPLTQSREDVQQEFSAVCKLPAMVGFYLKPMLSYGLHWLRFEVQGVDGSWITVHRTLLLCLPRAVLVKLGIEQQAISYEKWTRLERQRLLAEVPEFRRHIEVMPLKPVFTIIVDARQGSEGWKTTLRSIRAQIYPCLDLCVLKSPGAKLPARLAQVGRELEGSFAEDIRGNYMVLLGVGDSLAFNALYEFANAINQYPDTDLVYGDEDQLRAPNHRSRPFFRPDWSPDYLETFNYIGSPTCIRTAVAGECQGDLWPYDLTLQVTERTSRIVHVAKILGHKSARTPNHAELKASSQRDMAALSGRLMRTGRRGTIREHEMHPGCYDIQLDLRLRPLVSIVIPTAGKTVMVGERRLDLICNVVEQIMTRSSYRNIEITVVDNGNLAEGQLRTLVANGCRTVTYTEPVFNISKKLNLGASLALGEYLLLMNDDIEILTPSWIERMLEHFEKPHVGVVGAKLLYPDGQLQHAGVVHYYGNPDHVKRPSADDDAGYFFSTCGVRNFNAVTGAVMLTKSSLFREVGGYSEELAVCFNDTDYCLKVAARGLFTVFAPKVVLTHMESLSRTATVASSEIAWYHKRWAQETVTDRFYNERFLTVAPPTFMTCSNQRLV